MPGTSGCLVPAGAGASPAGLALPLELAGDQLVQERREVDGQARLPARAAVGVVLGRKPVENAANLAELPLDVDLAGADVVALQADRLAPPQARVTVDRQPAVDPLADRDLARARVGPAAFPDPGSPVMCHPASVIRSPSWFTRVRPVPRGMRIN